MIGAVDLSLRCNFDLLLVPNTAKYLGESKGINDLNWPTPRVRTFDALSPSERAIIATIEVFTWHGCGKFRQ
jgi:hypothetical protein